MSSPRLRRYLQLDVFADRPGAGNPLGVVFDAVGMDTAAMQAFAAWTNLSETIFLLPPTVPEADYRVRIFTPRQELPFAGHPSVGAAWAVLEVGIAAATNGRLLQECTAGVLPVRIDARGAGRVVHVRAPKAVPLDDSQVDAGLLAAAMASLPIGTQTPARWRNGPTWWTVELRDADAVAGMTPDLGAIAVLTRATDAIGLAVYGRTHATRAGDPALVVRAYCPADNIPEDPVTGSANACIAAQLANAHALPWPDGCYLASQGRQLGRDGRVHVQVDTQREVWIGGSVQLVIDGHVAWPSPMDAGR